MPCGVAPPSVARVHRIWYGWCYCHLFCYLGWCCCLCFSVGWCYCHLFVVRLMLLPMSWFGWCYCQWLMLLPHAVGWCYCLGGWCYIWLFIRVNDPSLNRNIGKYHLPHIWDEVLHTTSELKLKWPCGHSNRPPRQQHQPNNKQMAITSANWKTKATTPA